MDTLWRASVEDREKLRVREREREWSLVRLIGWNRDRFRF